MKCSKCKRVHYCCRDCQISHWGQHKQECKSWSKALERAGEGEVGAQSAHNDEEAEKKPTEVTKEAEAAEEVGAAKSAEQAAKEKKMRADKDRDNVAAGIHAFLQFADTMLARGDVPGAVGKLDRAVRMCERKLGACHPLAAKVGGASAIDKGQDSQMDRLRR
jgi:hypothetical protein